MVCPAQKTCFKNSACIPYFDFLLSLPLLALVEIAKNKSLRRAVLLYEISRYNQMFGIAFFLSTVTNVYRHCDESKSSGTGRPLWVIFGQPGFLNMHLNLSLRHFHIPDLSSECWVQFSEGGSSRELLGRGL